MHAGYVTTYFSNFYRGPMYYLLKEMSRRIDVTSFASSEQSYQYYKGRAKIEKDERCGPRWDMKRFDILFKLRGFVYPKNLTDRLEEAKLDLIHSNEYYQPISWQSLKIAQRKKIPFIFTQRRPEIENSYKFAFPILDFFGRRVVEQSDLITALSNPGKRLLLQRFPQVPEEKVVVIPSGIDTTRFRNINPRRFLKKHRIPENRPIVMTVGRMFRQKRVDLLVQIFSKVKEEVRDAALVFVGPTDGPEMANIRRVISALGLKEVYFTGAIDNKELPDAYASADVFCLTSEKEPFGYVLVEAGYCSKPLLAFNVGGVSDIIKDGKNGFLFQFGDLDGYVKKVISLLQDAGMRKRVGSAAKKTVESKFTIEKVAAQQIKLYNSLL